MLKLDKKKGKKNDNKLLFGTNKVFVKFLKERPNYWITSGWLPTAEKRREFCNKLTISKKYDDWDKTIKDLHDYVLYNSAVRQGFERMCIESIAEYGDTTPITSLKDMCGKLNAIIQTAPAYSNDKSNPLVGVPMAALFADCATNSPGMALMLSQEFNNYLQPVINKWKNFLDSQESWLNDKSNGWLSKDATKEWNIDDYVKQLPNSPYYKSWNDFFTRKYKDGIRKNTPESDDYVIQLPNDGTFFQYQNNVQLKSRFWLKDMPYDLIGIFGAKYKQFPHYFVGGSIFQSYLDPFNYHCYNAPVNGTIIVADVLEGAYFPQLVWLYDIPDSGAGTLSLPWLTEVNARGILVINTATIGKVCLIAIGMGEVSSVNWDVSVGDNVKKGDVVGCFKFGGSSICVLTENMNKYNSTLTYDDKFKKDPTPEGGHGPTFYVKERMASVKKNK